MTDKEYSLSVVELESISDLHKELEQVTHDINQQRIGMLRLIVKQQGLKGTVRMAEDGTKLIVEA